MTAQLQQSGRAKLCFAPKTHTVGNDGQQSAEQICSAAVPECTHIQWNPDPTWDPTGCVAAAL